MEKKAQNVQQRTKWEPYGEKYKLNFFRLSWLMSLNYFIEFLRWATLSALRRREIRRSTFSSDFRVTFFIDTFFGPFDDTSEPTFGVDETTGFQSSFGKSPNKPNQLAKSRMVIIHFIKEKLNYLDLSEASRVRPEILSFDR